jgi:hypothetical protein
MPFPIGTDTHATDNEVLVLLNQHLVDYGSSLAHFPMLPTVILPPEVLYIPLKEFEICELATKVAENEVKLNAEQHEIYEAVVKAVESDTSTKNIFFLDSPGGCGKTFLLNSLLSKIQSLDHPTAAVATSGIAASLLKDGTTAHSRFAIPLNLQKETICNVEMGSIASQRLSLL